MTLNRWSCSWSLLECDQNQVDVGVTSPADRSINRFFSGWSESVCSGRFPQWLTGFNAPTWKHRGCRERWLTLRVRARPTCGPGFWPGNSVDPVTVWCLWHTHSATQSCVLVLLCVCVSSHTHLLTADEKKEAVGGSENRRGNRSCDLLEIKLKLGSFTYRRLHWGGSVCVCVCVCVGVCVEFYFKVSAES